MRTVFQIIKAFAIVLAVMIIVSIVSTVIVGVESLGMLGHSRDESEIVVTGAAYDGVKNLDVNVKATELRIRETDSDSIKVETTSKYIDQWKNSETLYVTERSHGVFGWNAVGATTIYLPKNIFFQYLKLEVGAGMLTADVDLYAGQAALDFGAGRAVLEGLYVNDRAKIKAGAGLLEINHGKVKDLNLEMGAGKAAVNLRLVGDNYIQAGAGKLELGLVGAESDYTISVHKGIGSVMLGDVNLGDNQSYGSGVNRVEVESGVGAVEIWLKSGESDER